MKKIIINIMSAFIVFIVLIGSANALKTELDRINEREKYLERNWELTKISSEIQNYIHNHYGIQNQFEGQYPDYYGGIYINDDATSIIIQIVEKNIPGESSDEYQVYKKIIGMDSSIKVEFVENSMNELIEVNNNIIDNIDESISGDIISTYVDIINNKVAVEVSAESNLLKSKSIDMSNIDIVIVKIAEPGKLTSNLNPGQLYKIYKPTNGTDLTKVAECSVGFRSKYNGRDGFVTAGHCFMYGTSLTIGTASLIHFSDGGYYDYAFVETKDGYTPTNKLSNPLKNTTTLAVVDYCPTLTVGTAIAKDGAGTQDTEGKITALNTTIKYDDGTTLKGMIKSNLSTYDGDSGGVVYIPRLDSNGGPIPIGVLSGGAKGFLGIGAWMAFTSINNLPSEIQSSRY